MEEGNVPAVKHADSATSSRRCDPSVPEWSRVDPDHIYCELAVALATINNKKRHISNKAFQIKKYQNKDYGNNNQNIMGKAYPGKSGSCSVG